MRDEDGRDRESTGAQGAIVLQASEEEALVRCHSTHRHLGLCVDCLDLGYHLTCEGLIRVIDGFDPDTHYPRSGLPA